MCFLYRLWLSEIRSEAELKLYVGRTTARSVCCAVSISAVDQVVFFSSWGSMLHICALAFGIAGCVAFVASRAIGRTQLELYRAKVEVEHLSRTDPLTGLLNRRALFASEDTADDMALAIVDIDHFKQVNDRYGHLVGDAVICAVARLMADHLGDLGRVGRVGGEEFAFLSSKVAQKLLELRLNKFREAVASASISVEGQKVSVSVSGGLALRFDDQSIDELYVAADRALYAAKASGRNRILTATAIEPRGNEDLTYTIVMDQKAA
ncbi:diguanylate cyclase (GGDEF)-like protein [Methylorubrum rhodinum]|uniref:diguanylate cyclase n=1 Tax=Methylorubrum rhodinum TaxID=29428 RepID=A0A840ZCU4_9HYPH|nr:GGDEF domain-containing protein [Methylorubrum rhodinum]MBB5755702.1 diguanylate cyclase (GGDEF)-like protein [Methylorubrum rhodinum]